MSALQAKARAVVEAWDTGDLAAAVRALAEELEEQDELREKFKVLLEEGREWNDMDGVEVDAEPLISEVYDPDDDELIGIWVEAWVWVQNEESV